jgi:hypothetical protein
LIDVTVPEITWLAVDSSTFFQVSRSGKKTMCAFDILKQRAMQAISMAYICQYLPALFAPQSSWQPVIVSDMIEEEAQATKFKHIL